MRANEIILEATDNIKWKGWTIRFEVGVKKGQPVRWMAFHDKRGPTDAHKGQSDSTDQAIKDAQEWILSGGNAKKEFSSSVTIDFNVKFVQNILNGVSEEFYARIEPGPTLFISKDQLPGYKRSHLRNVKAADSEQTTALPMISLTKSDAKEAGLVPHGRYILGDTVINDDGTNSYPLIYQSTVQAKGDTMRLPKPALTVAVNRNARGE
jgi:hypothetical protein